ncbi:MAG: cytochrome c oxidase subunit II [Flavobacteriales bacterium]
MTNILIFIIAFLLLATLIQILRVSELMAAVQKTDVNEVNEKDNIFNSKMMLIVGSLFLISFVWQYFEWRHLLLPPASSEHGVIIDELMTFTMLLIIFVFFITQPLLFWYSYKYRKGKGNETAYYFVHHNKLEIIWTVVPAIVLTGVILYGLSTWNKITNADVSDSQVIELYAQQFNWTARYSGADNILGSAHYRLVKGTNALGVNMEDPTASDDKMTREVHLIKGKPILLKLRSQDVIHSAFLPHFRVQMNCVPGMTTQFAFTPTKTTAEMKAEEGDDFEYVLLCNKICGVSHYNMKMKFIVETQEEYNTWLSSQKTLSEKLVTQK